MRPLSPVTNVGACGLRVRRLIRACLDRRFSLKLWFYNPHTPLESKPELVEKYRARIKTGLKHQNPDYAAIVERLDSNVGRVLQKLKQRQLADRTLVIFASDNGGTVIQHKGRQITDNSPLRSGKGSLHEGGIRVPLIVRMPGVTPRGQVCEVPVTCTDFFPTIRQLFVVGAKDRRAPNGPFDGQSLVPLLREPDAHWNRDALLFRYRHNYTTTTPVSAVRQGDWKLLEHLEDSHIELYNLREDPGEQRDLATRQRDRAKQL